VVSGQDAEVQSVKSILRGEQYSTVFKDTRELAKVAANMVDAVLSGKQPEINDTKTYNNGVKVVPSYLLKPVSVDSSNWKKVLIDSGYYKEAGQVTLRHAWGPRVRASAMDRILEMRGITKTFPGVEGAQGREPLGRSGEIHAVVGENGAGKSTLMKVLSGRLPARLLRRRDPLRRRAAPLPRHLRQRGAGHHHHPPGAGAGAAAVDRREHLPGQRAGRGSA
jgi:hypothetical protein